MRGALIIRERRTRSYIADVNKIVAQLFRSRNTTTNWPPFVARVVKTSRAVRSIADKKIDVSDATCRLLRNSCSILVFSAKIELKVSERQRVIKRQSWRSRIALTRGWKCLARLEETYRVRNYRQSLVADATADYEHVQPHARHVPRLRVVDGYTRHVTTRRGSYFTRARDSIRRRDFFKIYQLVR